MFASIKTRKGLPARGGHYSYSQWQLQIIQERQRREEELQNARPDDENCENSWKSKRQRQFDGIDYKDLIRRPMDGPQVARLNAIDYSISELRQVVLTFEWCWNVGETPQRRLREGWDIKKEKKPSNAYKSWCSLGRWKHSEEGWRNSNTIKQQDGTQEPKQVSFGDSKVEDSDINAADGTSKRTKNPKLKTFLIKVVIPKIPSKQWSMYWRNQHYSKNLLINGKQTTSCRSPYTNEKRRIHAVLFIIDGASRKSTNKSNRCWKRMPLLPWIHFGWQGQRWEKNRGHRIFFQYHSRSVNSFVSSELQFPISTRYGVGEYRNATACGHGSALFSIWGRPTTV